MQHRVHSSLNAEHSKTKRRFVGVAFWVDNNSMLHISCEQIGVSLLSATIFVCYFECDATFIVFSLYTWVPCLSWWRLFADVVRSSFSFLLCVAWGFLLLTSRTHVDCSTQIVSRIQCAEVFFRLCFFVYAHTHAFILLNFA